MLAAMLDDASVSQAYGFAEKAIRCAACCVDPSPARAVAAAKRWPHLEHYWLDERAIRDLGVGRVPSRLVVDGDAHAVVPLAEQREPLSGRVMCVCVK